VQTGAVQAAGTALLQEVVHESRLLYFRGVMTARMPVANGQFWDDSVLQRVHEAVKHSSSNWMSASHLMSDASQGVLSIQNLMQLLSTSGEALLRKRMQMMDIARSVCRSILVDAEKEKFERVSTSFTGIPELLDRSMMRVSAAAQMPVTILFGRSPAGLNATGESDTRAWYDTVAAERADVLLPKLEQLVRLVMATDGGPTKGQVLDGWEITFPPLWQETAAEKATTFKTEADALAGLVNAQIVQPEEAALRLAHSGCFPELDVESREKALEVVLERVANPPDPADLPPPLDPNALPNPNKPPANDNGDDPP
jgi:phage-related protein (TIGR01555 family)